MKIRSLGLALLVAGAFCTGCSTRHGDFTLISTKNVDLEKLSRARTVQNPVPVNGYDVQHYILFFPVTPAASLEDAIDDAMEKANGDCMVDTAVYSYWWYIPLIYGQSGWKVRGRVLNTYLSGLERPTGRGLPP